MDHGAAAVVGLAVASGDTVKYLSALTEYRRGTALGVQESWRRRSPFGTRRDRETITSAFL